MADNYCQWSESIEVTDEEAAWLNQVLSLEFKTDEDLDIDADLESFRPNALDDLERRLYSLDVDISLDDESWPNFDYRISDTENNGLKDFWVHSDEYGNLNNLVAVVEALINKFRKDYIFTLTFAETCSRPRVSQFGGGAVVVTAAETYWFSTYSWVEQKVKEIKSMAAV